MTEAHDRRFPALEGSRNFRDLGGYETADGRRVRWGMIYRSGTLSGITGEGQAALAALGVRTLIDLRTTDERIHQPVPWFATDDRSHWSRDYAMGFGELREMLSGGGATPASARDSMILGYRRLIFEQVPSYRELFARLLADAVPLTVNCSAGKDRAGMASALILLALGVPRETVAEDYLVTNTVYEGEGAARFSSSPLLADVDPGVVEAVRTCHVDYLGAALDAIDERHGGVEAYLRAELGVGAEQIDALRGRFTE